jgi:hypothetical protein
MMIIYRAYYKDNNVFIKNPSHDVIYVNPIKKI